MRLPATCLFLTLCLAFAQPARGQQQRVELNLPKTTMELSESIEGQLICYNTGQPTTPNGAVPEGLDVKLANSVPAQSITIINGRSSSKHTFQLVLTATAVGTYELGPFSVTADGRTYETDTVTITVRQTEPTGQRGDQFVFAEIKAQPESVYVTQTVNAVLTFGIREVEIGGRRYTLNMLRDVLDLGRSKLSVFAGNNADQSTMIIADSRGRRHRYIVYTVKAELRAEEVGPLEIGPVFLKAEYPTQIRRGFFGYDVLRSRAEFARTDQIVVNVKGPPDEGRPESYVGALGNYKMDVSARPVDVEQGKPVTLTITIMGSPVDGVPGPDLAGMAELASRFDFTREELIGDVQGNRKTFRRAIFPKQAGSQVIPPIEWSFFDPRAESYVTLKSDPIPLNVAPASQSATTIDLGDPGGNSGTELTVLTGGLSPNYVDPQAVLADGRVALSPLTIGGLAAAPLAYLGLLLVTTRRDRLRRNRGLARRRNAARRAERAIREALDRPDDTAQWMGIGDALKGYLADRFDLPPGEITPGEARTLVRGPADDIADEVGSFLDSCNAIAYAPVGGGAESAGETADRIRRWIRRLERSGGA